MASKFNKQLYAADRKMRKFFKNIWKKIKRIPVRARQLWEVAVYLFKHPKEIRQLLPTKAQLKRFGKKAGTFAITAFLILLITGSMIGCVLVVYVVNNFDGTTGLPNLNNLSMDATSIIWVQNEKNGEWEEYQHLEGVNSIWVDMEQIPKHMQQAVIAIEDERFATHYGVDWKRTVSAFANLVFHFSETEYGGSTITQQLIKVTTGENEHNWTRKVTEILRAVELEKQYDKDTILEAYLNNLPLSNNVVGVGAAANYFFGKEVQDLTIAESAVIAGITQNPSRYNPYTRPENIRRRQRLVLQKMNELGFITDDEYIQAVGEELQYKSTIRHDATWDYYVDLVVEDVVADLQEQYGYTKSYATQMVFYGGLNIYSAEIPKEQAAVEAVFENEANFPKHIEGDPEDPQAAMFVMDYNGRVVATVGGRGEKEGKRAYNRSTQSYRSPGSSTKPLTAYGPAIAMDVVHWSTVVRDAPIMDIDGKPWPANYNSKPKDNGNTFVYYGLQESLNTVAATLVRDVTPQKCFDFGTSIFKLSSLVKSQTTEDGRILTDIALSPLALGAYTNGVYARDMAAAFAVFGNGGYYNEPFTYYEVYENGTRDDGNKILQRGPQNIRVMDEGSTYVMNRMMQRVVRYGTGASIIGNSWGKEWELYGKTGTGESNRDVYFSGGTPYYAGTTWFGYDNNQEMSSGQPYYARRLWNQAMKALHKNLEPKTFDKKGGTEELEFCTYTGQLATDKCPKTDIGVYKSTNKPDVCSTHAGNLKTTTDPNATTAPTAETTAGTNTTTATTAGETTVTTFETALTTAPTTETTVAE